MSVSGVHGVSWCTCLAPRWSSSPSVPGPPSPTAPHCPPPPPRLTWSAETPDHASRWAPGAPRMPPHTIQVSDPTPPGLRHSHAKISPMLNMVYANSQHLTCTLYPSLMAIVIVQPLPQRVWYLVICFSRVPWHAFRKMDPVYIGLISFDVNYHISDYIEADTFKRYDKTSCYASFVWRKLMIYIY